MNHIRKTREKSSEFQKISSFTRFRIQYLHKLQSAIKLTVEIPFLCVLMLSNKIPLYTHDREHIMTCVHPSMRSKIAFKKRKANSRTVKKQLQENFDLFLLLADRASDGRTGGMWIAMSGHQQRKAFDHRFSPESSLVCGAPQPAEPFGWVQEF